jgi:hypothetical protein
MSYLDFLSFGVCQFFLKILIFWFLVRRRQFIDDQGQVSFKRNRVCHTVDDLRTLVIQLLKGRQGVDRVDYQL